MNTETLKVKVETTFFDLESFESVPVIKTADYTPVPTVEAALAALGNDNTKLLEVINRGMIANVRRDLKSDPSGWHTFNDDGTINGEYSGTPADDKKVNPFVLNMAKTVFGYDKSLPKEERAARKQKAIDWIKNSAEIRAGLAVNCALTAEDEE